MGGQGALGIVVDGVARLQVHRGQVAGAGLLRLQLGDIERHGGLAHGRLLFLRFLHPFTYVARCIGGQLYGLGQGQGGGAGAAHELVERQAFDVQVVFGGDFLRHDDVVACLGFALVRDGAGAHLEIALGCGELLLHRGLLRAHEGQRVLRGQHVEIALAHAHQQVLCRGVKLCLGHVDAALSLLIANAVGRPVQGLRSRQRDVAVRRGEIDLGTADLGARRGHTRRQARAGQQARTRLVGAAGGRIQLGPGGLPGGVVATGLLHQGQQALRLCRAGQGSHGQRDGETAERDHDGPSCGRGQ